MKGFRVNVEAEIDVVFLDEPKAEAFFLEHWKAELNTMASHIAHHFQLEEDIWNEETDNNCFFTSRKIEDLTDFIEQDDGNYLAKDTEYGDILIIVKSEAEPTYIQCLSLEELPPH